MATENYEVYYFQNGRWHVHARYEAEEREIAIEEAISVESKLGYPARVIRETFYADTNTTEETVTYQGTKAKKLPTRTRCSVRKVKAEPDLVPKVPARSQAARRRRVALRAPAGTPHNAAPVGAQIGIGLLLPAAAVLLRRSPSPLIRRNSGGARKRSTPSLSC